MTTEEQRLRGNYEVKAQKDYEETMNNASVGRSVNGLRPPGSTTVPSSTSASGSSASQGTPWLVQTLKVPRLSSTEPCRPRMTFAGPGTLLPRVSGPATGSGERQAKSGIITSREHDRQKAVVVKHKVHSVCKGSEEKPVDEGSLQPTPIESSPSSPGSVAGQERLGQRLTHSSVKKLDFEGSRAPADRSDQEPEPQPDHETAKEEGKGEGGNSQRDSLVCPLTIDYSFDHVDTPLHAVPAAVSWKDESHPSWVRIRTVMDSGAAQSVAPPSMAPGVIIEESPGSQRGQHYILSLIHI